MAGEGQNDAIDPEPDFRCPNRRGFEKADASKPAIDRLPTLQSGWHNPDQPLPLLAAWGQCHKVTSRIAD